MPEHVAIPEMRRLSDEGVTSYKLFMAYPGVSFSQTTATIFRAMRKAGEDGTLVCMHAENGVVIDELVQNRACPKAISSPSITRSPVRHDWKRKAYIGRSGHRRSRDRHQIYIVHLSSYDALHEIRQAQARGVMAHAETCPQYLLLDISSYDEPGLRRQPSTCVTPPLREKWNQNELWRGLRGGSLRRDLHGSLPLLRQGAEGTRARRLQQDSRMAVLEIENRMSLIYHSRRQ